jgi:hypothetical protein
MPIRSHDTPRPVRNLHELAHVGDVGESDKTPLILFVALRLSAVRVYLRSARRWECASQSRATGVGARRHGSARRRIWIIDVVYAKAAPDHICIQLVARNRSEAAATLDVLPTLWFRNTWR